jgi:hypothetical protein
MTRRGSAFAVAVGAAALLVGCQTITEEAPTSPSPVTLSPLVIPVIAAATPAPTPTPAPTATPAPTPTPTPEPSSPPSSFECSLPPSNPTSPVCTDDSPQLYAAVDTALTKVTEQNPSLFDFNDKKCDNCYYVKDVDRYIEEVGKQLARQGLCMAGDAEEIGVKKSNDFNEQYDILLSTQHMRRGPGSYRGVCRPALF